jgi:class 3 adenylate cyclase
VPAIDAAALSAAAGSDGRVALLVSALAPAGDAVHRAHREILEYWLPRHSGRTVATVDGAVVCGFPAIRHGLLCTVAVSRGFAAFNRGRPGDLLEVRTALHAGAAVVEEAVVALRIASAAEPGQVLVSSAVREGAGEGDEFAFGEPRTLEVAGRGPVAVLPLHPR